jgi:hypothetical protein
VLLARQLACLGGHQAKYFVFVMILPLLALSHQKHQHNTFKVAQRKFFKPVQVFPAQLSLTLTVPVQPDVLPQTSQACGKLRQTLPHYGTTPSNFFSNVATTSRNLCNSSPMVGTCC